MSKFSIERVTVLATPFYAAGAAWITGLVATNVPGAPPVNPAAVEGLEATVVLGTVAAIVKWLHGRQKPEIVALEHVAAKVERVADAIAPSQHDIVSEIEGVGEAELKRIYDVVKAKLPAPPAPLPAIPATGPAPGGDFVASAPPATVTIAPPAVVTAVSGAVAVDPVTGQPLPTQAI